MQPTFRTVGGSLVKCDRVDRRLIDSIWTANPPPQPPVIKVEVWGGVEEMPDYNDEEYEFRMGIYRLQIEHDIFSAFADVTEFDASETDLAAYATLKIFEQIELFRDVILGDDEDRKCYLDTCLYLSTVTEIAILDAIKRFGVTYLGKAIHKLALPGSYAERMQVFEDWQAAKYGNISWQRFCELSGPEQSEYVAFMRVDQAVKIRQEMERTRHVNQK